MLAFSAPEAPLHTGYDKLWISIVSSIANWTHVGGLGSSVLQYPMNRLEPSDGLFSKDI